MSWIRIDDQLHGHPKPNRAWAMHRATLGMHLMGLSYAGCYLTDGFLDSEAFVEQKLPAKREREAVTEAMVATGIWLPVGGGFQIHDFLEHNPSREQLVTRRRADSERKRGGIREDSE